MKMMDFTHKKADGTPRMKHRLLICVATVLLVIFIFSLIPRGGEIHEMDFLLGYEVYLEEAHLIRISNMVMIPEEHGIWHITDHTLEKEIYRLCQSISVYREKKAEEMLLGVPDVMQVDPVLYLKTNGYGYVLRVMNWENEHTAQETVSDEKLGMPLLHVSRYSMREKSEEIDVITYLKSMNHHDSVNGEGGAGWYSTLTQEEFDELLALLESVGEENAELVP